VNIEVAPEGTGNASPKSQDVRSLMRIWRDVLRAVWHAKWVLLGVLPLLVWVRLWGASEAGGMNSAFGWFAQSAGAFGAIYIGCVWVLRGKCFAPLQATVRYILLAMGIAALMSGFDPMGFTFETAKVFWGKTVIFEAVRGNVADSLVLVGFVIVQSAGKFALFIALAGLLPNMLLIHPVGWASLLIRARCAAGYIFKASFVGRVPTLGNRAGAWHWLFRFCGGCSCIHGGCGRRRKQVGCRDVACICIGDGDEDIFSCHDRGDRRARLRFGILPTRCGQ